MNAKATAARPATEAAPAEPSWTDAVAVIEAARADGARELTLDEQQLISRARSRAGRAGEMSIMAAGQLYDVACRRREVLAGVAAADLAQQGRRAQAASRQPAFDALPQWLRWEWLKLDRAGGLSTTEGRQMARLLGGIEQDEQLHVPSCYRPLAPEPGRY